MTCTDITTHSARDPEIIPLTQVEGLPVAPFDMKLLPTTLREWAQDIQYRLQCPADYVGVSVMIAVATVVGNKVRIQPKRNDHSWEVVPNLWGLLVGSPSSMKSPSISAAIKPIKKIDLRLRNERAERLLVTDTTIEELQAIQSLNPTGILYFQDEISALFRKFEQRNSKERPYLLEAFNGDSSYSVDRISRGNIYIEKNTLSLIGTIQPDLLQAICSSKGRSDDGFMQRLQLAVWPDESEVEYVDVEPNLDAEAEAWGVFGELYSTCHRILLFSMEAQVVFEDWYKQSIQVISDLKADGQHDLATHISKFRKLVPGLALLIELAEVTEATYVSRRSLKKAIFWANYLLTHAKRIYGIQDKSVILAQKILDKKDSLKKPFSPSEVARINWSGINTTEDVREGIKVLVKHNYLIKIEKPVGMKGGRPSEKYRWNNTLPLS